MIRFALPSRFHGRNHLRRNAERVALTRIDVLAELHKAQAHVERILGRPLEGRQVQVLVFRESIRNAIRGRGAA